jgi:hypothetical protein
VGCWGTGGGHRGAVHLETEIAIRQHTEQEILLFLFIRVNNCARDG